MFETDLARCWPNEKIEQTERGREIQAFAESHGWTAVILATEFGSRAIFWQASSDIAPSRKLDFKSDGNVLFP